MPSAREMRLRIRSIKNIGQVTRALQAVSASKVKKAVLANQNTLPYAEKTWHLLIHLARQPGRSSLHPLLKDRTRVRRILVILITSDRGLAGASNVNIVRAMLDHFDENTAPIDYICIGRKGQDLLHRGNLSVVADYSPIPSSPTFTYVATVGREVVKDYLNEAYDQVYVAYNHYVNMMVQKPTIRRLLPIEFTYDDKGGDSRIRTHVTHSVFTYEPERDELLNQIVPRITAMQIYQALLSAQASEHAARMVAMQNATENSNELARILQLEYNKIRQQSITNDLLDIVSGAVAMEKHD